MYRFLVVVSETSVWLGPGFGPTQSIRSGPVEGRDSDRRGDILPWY